jgi:hypothetical protein
VAVVLHSDVRCDLPIVAKTTATTPESAFALTHSPETVPKPSNSVVSGCYKTFDRVNHCNERVYVRKYWVNEYERIIREYSNADSNIHEHVHGAKIRTNNWPNFHIHVHIREYEYESNMAENLMFIFANMNIRPSLAINYYQNITYF